MSYRALAKYAIVFRVALSERLVYRVDFFVSTFLRFIPIITTILLWRAIYTGGDREMVGGLSYQQMVAYYLLVMVNRAFGSMPGLATEIAGDIREGELRKYLIQPIDYLVYQTTLRMAHKAVYFLMASGPYAIIFWICRDYLPGWPTPTMFLLIVLSCVLTFFLGFAINGMIGMLGFWFLEVASFVHVFMTAQYFLSGHMFPLSLLPPVVQKAVTWMPFAYETYYPTLILLQKLSVRESMGVIAVQAAWVVTLLLLMRIAWAMGLRRYAAFGG
ncbi:MAG: ABC-2 family transporter protein [Phycisphaerae bacterium]|nr:ABC-2 family transporter protein [Phycisphaerae bacterium]